MGNKIKVVVGMSGGVDSSVAAALLVQQGYSVSGVMLRLWSEPGREGSNRCCTPDSMAQARRVAANLGIPFYAMDVKELFYNEVVETFKHGYRQGITPNPCLVCNKNIRWGYLLKKSLTMGADFFATGHYARLIHAQDGSIQLCEGVDKSKDQSYVLSVLDQNQLAHTILPLGEYKKTEVRQLARDFDLPVAERADSQDLCFLAGSDYRQFLKTNLPDIARPGEIVDRQGSTLGQHEGLAYYTIGQRKGIRISSTEPLYVLEKNIDENRLVVGYRHELGSRSLVARKANWIDANARSKEFRGLVKIRYKAPKVWGTVSPEGDGFSVKFDDPQRDITAGQNAVIYQDELCLGCGLIDEVM